MKIRRRLTLVLPALAVLALVGGGVLIATNRDNSVKAYYPVRYPYTPSYCSDTPPDAPEPIPYPDGPPPQPADPDAPEPQPENPGTTLHAWCNQTNDVSKIEQAIETYYNSAPEGIKSHDSVKDAYDHAQEVIAAPDKRVAHVEDASRYLTNTVVDLVGRMLYSWSVIGNDLKALEGNISAVTMDKVLDIETRSNQYYMPGVNSGADETIAKIANLKKQVNDATDRLRALVDQYSDDNLANGDPAIVAVIKQVRQQASDMLADINSKTIHETNLMYDRLHQAHSELSVSVKPINDAMVSYFEAKAYVHKDQRVIDAHKDAVDVRMNDSRTPEQVQKAADDLKAAIDQVIAEDEARYQAHKAIYDALMARATEVTYNDIPSDSYYFPDVLDQDKSLSLRFDYGNFLSMINNLDYGLRQVMWYDEANDLLGKIPEDKKQAIQPIYDEIKRLSGHPTGNMDPSFYSTSIYRMHHMYRQLLDALDVYSLPDDERSYMHTANDYDISFMKQQPDYVQNHPEIVAAYDKVKQLNDSVDSSYNEMTSAGYELRKAIQNLIERSSKMQEDVRQMLASAMTDLSDQNIPANVMPNIDLTEIEAKINQVIDPTAKADLVKSLSEIRAIYDARQAQVNRLNNILNPGQAGQSANVNDTKSGNVADDNNNTSQKPNAPDTGAMQERMVGLLTAVGAALVAIITAGYAVFKKFRAVR